MPRLVSVECLDGVQSVDVAPLLQLQYYSVLFESKHFAVENALDLKPFGLLLSDFGNLYNYLEQCAALKKTSEEKSEGLDREEKQDSTFTGQALFSMLPDFDKAELHAYGDYVGLEEICNDYAIFKLNLSKSDLERIEHEYALREAYTRGDLVQEELLRDGRLHFLSVKSPYLTIGNPSEMYRKDIFYREQRDSYSVTSHASRYNLTRTTPCSNGQYLYSQLSHFRDHPLLDPRSNILDGYSAAQLVRDTLQGLFDIIDWDVLFLAGGPMNAIVLNALPKMVPLENQTTWYYRQRAIRIKDFDFFIICNDEERVKKQLRAIHVYCKSLNILRSEHAITFECEFGCPIQVITRIYADRQQVLTGFDIDAACVGFDGKSFVYTKRFLNAVQTMTNIVDPERQSKTYALRLFKYRVRGFSLALPGLKSISQINWLHHEQFANVSGLAKIIYLNLNGLYANPDINNKARVACDYDNAEVLSTTNSVFQFEGLLNRIVLANKNTFNQNTSAGSSPVYDVHASSDIENIFDIDNGSSSLRYLYQNPTDLVYSLNDNGHRIYPHLNVSFPRRLAFITKLPHSQISGSFHPTFESWFAPFAQKEVQETNLLELQQDENCFLYRAGIKQAEISGFLWFQGEFRTTHRRYPDKINEYVELVNDLVQAWKLLSESERAEYIKVAAKILEESRIRRNPVVKTSNNFVRNIVIVIALVVVFSVLKYSNVILHSSLRREL